MASCTEIFAWGSNTWGQLGHRRKKKSSPSLRPLKLNICISQLSCGLDHTVFLSSSGHLYSMGCNKEGRLGIGDRSLKSSHIPVLLPFPVASKICCGSRHTLAISTTGEAFAWGEGEFGALGQGSVTSQWKPTKMHLSTSSPVLDISCGDQHSVLIIDNSFNSGNLMVTGSGDKGQLGTGRKDRSLVPIPIQIKNIKSVACGLFHTLMLNTLGNVYACGANKEGQLGIGTRKHSAVPVKLNLENVMKIAAGSHSACITDAGDLYVWGASALGNFKEPYRLTIGKFRGISVGNSIGVAVDLEGTLHAWDSNYRTIKPENVVCDVQCGGNFCIGIGKECKGVKRRAASMGNNLQFENARLRSEIENKEIVFSKETRQLKEEYEEKVRNLQHSLRISKELNMVLEAEDRKKEEECQKISLNLKNSTQVIEGDLDRSQGLNRNLSELNSILEKLKIELAQASLQADSEAQNVSRLETALKLAEKEQDSFQSQIRLAQHENLDMQSLLENSVKQEVELKREINRLKAEEIEWEHLYAEKKKENEALREQVESLTCSHKEMIAELDRELTFKARDYKAKTLYILNNPNM